MKDQYQQQQAQDQKVLLRYQSVEVEGQCTLKEISPLRFVPWRYVLFLISNVCLMVPWFMTFWYPHYERIFYYAFCTLEQATHFHVLNYDGQISIVAKQERVFMIDEERSRLYTCFVNRYMTYVVDKEVVRVSMYDYRQRLARIGGVKHRQQGLSEAQAHELKNTYGTGTMIVHRPGLMTLTVQQILRPLYIFIFSSVAYWVYLKYFYFSGIIFFFSVIGISINLYQVMQQFEKIFMMAYYQVQIHVLRNGKVESISSLDVVPGDIVFLKEAIKIPFQGIILQGSVLINECALTGESAPVVKKADTFERLANTSLSIDKNSFIYEGTTIIEANNKKKISKFQEFREEYGLPVCVIRTNFVTTKGQLIRIILFPKQQENIFQIQAYKFILVVLLIIVATYLIITLLIYQYTVPSDLIYTFFNLITIAVTPALPISMTFGIIYAIERLELKKIFCIAQNKVIDGGMTDFCCFDKTGTLTQEGMDFHTLVSFDGDKFVTPIINNQHSINQILNQDYPYINDALTNMAANNTIVKIQATGQLVGDPMEVKTFNFGNFFLNQSHPNHEVIFAFESERGHNGIIVKRFEFDSDLQRMSVVCQRTLDNAWKVYTKGSPQILLTIIKKETIPKDYDAVLKKYASCGFRVLAIASRQVSQVEAKVITRNEAEHQLQFNGFQVFENRLKPETKGAISVLKNALIGCVMITGDNTLTGSNISYKCGISSEEKGMIICDFNNGFYTEESFQFYKDSTDQSEDRKVESKKDKLDMNLSYDYLDLNPTQPNVNPVPASIELITTQKYQQTFMSLITSRARITNSQLCVTGRAFNQLFPGTISDLTQEEKRFMRCVTVFARTKPNEKARIVMAYQHMGLRVAMCGDGANDCGALKQADIGLSLSQAEASISAPFTSQIPNITSMIELIKECRTGLATNFSLFNIIAMYSFIQFTTTVICQRYLQVPKDAQYLYWDLCLNFSFILVVGYTKTAKQLSVEKPRGSLWSVTNLMQIIVAFLLQGGAQISFIAIYCAANSDYFWENGGLDNAIANYTNNKRLSAGLQANILFLFSNNLYVVTMIAFNIAKPWREYFLTNLPLMFTIVLTLAYNQLLILLGDSAWAEFHANDFVPDMKMRWIIFGASLGFSIIIYAVQKLIMEPISSKLIESYPHIKWL